MKVLTVVVLGAFLAGCAGTYTADKINYNSGLTGTKIAGTNVKVKVDKRK